MSATPARPLRLWPRPFWRWFASVDPLHKDIALAVVVAIASVLELTLAYDLGSAPATLGALAVVCVAIALRRRHPAAAPIAAVGAVTVQDILGGTLSQGGDAAWVGLLLMLYGLGAYCEFRVALLAGAATWCLFVVDTQFDAFSNSLSDYLFFTMFVAAAITIGRAIRNRRLLNRALRERTARLEAEREDRARDAVAAERRRIAAELHDVVTHAVSSMVVQAGAVRHVVHRDPSAAGSTLGDIELTGRDALAEMRRLLGVLRREDEEHGLAPQPGVARLADLAARARTGGLDVDLEVVGEPVTLSPGLDLVAYRAVEEALRAAGSGVGASRAEVRVTYGDRELELEVTDDGGQRQLAGLDTDPQLISIRERVALFGGEFHAGAAREGFMVRARLPIERPVAA